MLLTTKKTTVTNRWLKNIYSLLSVNQIIKNYKVFTMVQSTKIYKISIKIILTPF